MTTDDLKKDVLRRLLTLNPKNIIFYINPPTKTGIAEQRILKSTDVSALIIKVVDVLLFIRLNVSSRPSVLRPCKPLSILCQRFCRVALCGCVFFIFRMGGDFF